MGELRRVRDLEKFEGYTFIVQDREVAEMNAEYKTDYVSFFVLVDDCEIVSLYGTYYVVPRLENLLYKVI